jgi:hypothetical protein
MRGLSLVASRKRFLAVVSSFDDAAILAIRCLPPPCWSSWNSGLCQSSKSWLRRSLDGVISAGSFHHFPAAGGAHSI